MCCQEWYLEGTYDAKRRATELRHLGFEVNTKSVGEVPLDNGKEEIVVAKMTVLTVTYRENERGELLVPPEPSRIAAGLVVG